MVKSIVVFLCFALHCSLILVCFARTAGSFLCCAMRKSTAARHTGLGWTEVAETHEMSNSYHTHDTVEQVSS